MPQPHQNGKLQSLNHVLSNVLCHVIFTSHYQRQPNFNFQPNIKLQLKGSPPEDHAGKSTAHITDSPETLHTCTTSLVH